MIRCKQTVPAFRISRLNRLEGGGQLRMLGHVLTSRLDVKKVIKSLPLTGEDVPIRAVVTTAFTSEQRLTLLRDFVVRREKIVRYLHVMKYEFQNPLYSDICLNIEALQKLPGNAVYSDVIESSDELNTAAREKDRSIIDLGGSVSSAPASRVSATSAQSVVSSGPVQSVVEWSTSIQIVNAEKTNEQKYTATSVSVRDLFTIASNDSKACAPKSANGTVSDKPTDTKAFIVRASSEPVWTSNPEWLETAFAHLFPFKRGGVRDEARTIHLSLDKYLRHLLLLSTRQFQAAEFVLHAYDMLSTKQTSDKSFYTARAAMRGRPVRPVVPSTSASSASVASASSNGVSVSSDDVKSSKYSKFSADLFGSISSSSIQQVMKQAAARGEARDSASKRSDVRPVFSADVPDQAKQFVSTLRRMCAECQHTPEHAVQIRNEVFGLSNELGTATWWYVDLFFYRSDRLSYDLTDLVFVCTYV